MDIEMKLGETLLIVLVCTCSSAMADDDRSAEPSKPVMREKLSPEQAGELLDRISDTMRGLTSLKADFTQERHMAAFEDTLVARGTMYFRSPDNIRWELSEPYRSALVFDGERIAKFVFDDGHRRKLKVGSPEIMQEVLKFIALWIQGEFESSRRFFDLAIERVCTATSSSRTDKPSETNCHLVLLFTPRSKGMMDRIRSIELTMDKDSRDIDRVTIRERQGDQILIRFTNRICDLEFAEDLFSLD